MIRFIKMTDSFKTPDCTIEIWEGNNGLYYWQIVGDLNEGLTEYYGKYTRNECIDSAIDHYTNHRVVSEFIFKLTPTRFSVDTFENTFKAYDYANAVSQVKSLPEWQDDTISDYDLIEVR